MHRNIVVAASPADRATRDALALGVALARPRGAEIVLAHVHTGAADPMPLLADMAAGVPADVPTRPVVYDAPAVVGGLHRAVAEHHAELLVVGPTHASALTRAARGDVALGAVRDASCAVASAPDGYAERPPVKAWRIGVAWDGTAESWEALEWAVQLAERCAAELLLIRVLDETDDEDAARRRMGSVRLAIEDRVPATVDIRHGDPGHALADGGDLDLLVLGSRGRGPVARVLRGSVSAHVIREAACPVVVIPRGVLAPVETAGV